MSFQIPTDLKNITFIDRKNAEIKTIRGERILCPYDGEIEDTSTSTCNGLIKIKHNFNNKIYYSVLCGVDNINVFRGIHVRKGGTIGFSSGSDIKFNILDRRNNKLEIDQFLNPTNTNQPTTSGTSTTNVVPPVVDDKKNKKKEDEKDKYDTKKFKSGDKTGVLDLFLNLGLSPFEFVHKGLGGGYKKKKKDEDELDELTEEIQRIKKLL